MGRPWVPPVRLRCKMPSPPVVQNANGGDGRPVPEAGELARSRDAGPAPGSKAGFATKSAHLPRNRRDNGRGGSDDGGAAPLLREHGHHRVLGGRGHLPPFGDDEDASRRRAGRQCLGRDIGHLAFRVCEDPHRQASSGPCTPAAATCRWLTPSPHPGGGRTVRRRATRRPSRGRPTSSSPILPCSPSRPPAPRARARG